MKRPANRGPFSFYGLVDGIGTKPGGKACYWLNTLRFLQRLHLLSHLIGFGRFLIRCLAIGFT